MPGHPLLLKKEIWHRFVESNFLDLQLIQPEIVHSWQRCRELNVNPYANVGDDIRGLELKERLHSLQHLLTIARPFMDNLYNFIRGSGFQVVLADEQGLLLEVMGDPDIIMMTRQVQLCPGGNWSEAVKGTNAIGTAIAEQRPVQVHAHEHYCQANHFLTCSAAPIFDPDGKLIGVLDITGNCNVANPHTLGMVVAAVNAIESQLRLQRATTKVYMAYKYSSFMMESMSEGLLSVDNAGMIVQMNAKGGRILGVTPNDAIGRHINEVIKKQAPILQVLSTGSGYQDREITLEASGRRFYSSATPLRDDYGNIIGAVATLREQVVRPSLKRNPLLAARYVFEDIIGESEPMMTAKQLAQRAAQSASTVLLTGESGTGKELFAQSIHNASSRRAGPFIAIHCAALPESLIESELFGYEEGAFTGSKRGGQMGKFEQASGGTIFLDEIGDMPLSTQVKLLRVIQEKKVSRIGAVGEIPIDIRIIAATHKDLKAEVEKGNFRKDLYYRLHVITIAIPALRDRRGDLPLLTEHFVRNISDKLSRRGIYFDDSFIERIKSYDWPGNVRELESAVERAINLIDDYGVLTSAFLPFENDLSVAVHDNDEGTAVKSLKTIEKESIIQALVACKGNISAVSAKLGIGRNTLYRKIKEYDIILSLFH
ncbi:MAG: sigma-54-dependent Fis family transcriptional regulator [Nitrospirota bacterium]